MQDFDPILKFWFGHVEDTILPTENRARIWFAESPDVDLEISSKFQTELEQAIRGDLVLWEESAHGQLALIIMLDQLSRHVYRGTPKAFAQDDYAMAICKRGLELQLDHELSLIERVFYYFPLLHAEHIRWQEEAVRCYEVLMELAFPETRIIYESFFKFANHHYNIIQRFGRFPQRNAILGRTSTPEELKFLEEIKSSSV